MNADLRDLVRRRAGDRCEYCHIPQEATPLITFHVEHIVARQHEEMTEDDPSRLALSCDRCNAYKGPNLTSIDPESGDIVALFHPRQEAWRDHFLFHGGKIVGLTATGAQPSDY